MTAPHNPNLSWDQTLSHIKAASTLWVRLAAVPHEDGWQVRQLEMTSGEAPPNWERREWPYPGAWFVAETTSGPEVVHWLSADKLVLNDCEAALPTSQDQTQVRWERRASRVAGPFETLPWPSTETSLPLQILSQAEPAGHMLAANLPSFVTFYAAAVSFFGYETQPVGGSIQPAVVYRHQDLSGRINRVRITDDGVDVEIEGEGIDGMTIELAGDKPGLVHRVFEQYTRTDSAHFDLADGLPPGAWVLLKHGNHLID